MHFWVTNLVFRKESDNKNLKKTPHRVGNCHHSLALSKRAAFDNKKSTVSTGCVVMGSADPPTLRQGSWPLPATGSGHFHALPIFCGWFFCSVQMWTFLGTSKNATVPKRWGVFGHVDFFAQTPTGRNLTIYSVWYKPIRTMYEKKHQIPSTESSWSISYQSMEIMASQPTPPNEIASLKGLLTIRFNE